MDDDLAHLPETFEQSFEGNHCPPVWDVQLLDVSDTFEAVFEGDHRGPLFERELRELPDAYEDIFLGEHGSKRFPLFKLPPEIWLKVCEYAVTSSRPINVTKYPDRERQVFLVHQPAITLTCHLLRNEALPVFYKNNVFEARHFCEHACPRQWLVAIGIQNLKAIGTFQLYTRMSETFWQGCFERAGITTKVAITSTEAKGQCPRHKHGSFQTLTITFV